MQSMTGLYSCPPSPLTCLLMTTQHAPQYTECDNDWTGPFSGYGTDFRGQSDPTAITSTALTPLYMTIVHDRVPVLRTQAHNTSLYSNDTKACTHGFRLCDGSESDKQKKPPTKGPRNCACAAADMRRVTKSSLPDRGLARGGHTIRACAEAHAPVPVVNI